MLRVVQERSGAEKERNVESKSLTKGTPKQSNIACKIWLIFLANLERFWIDLGPPESMYSTFEVRRRRRGGKRPDWRRLRRVTGRFPSLDITVAWSKYYSHIIQTNASKTDVTASWNDFVVSCGFLCSRGFQLGSPNFWAGCDPETNQRGRPPSFWTNSLPSFFSYLLPSLFCDVTLCLCSNALPF